MAAAEFVHLHVHSHYSLLDGAIKLDKLFRRAKELDFPAVALTDHGNLHGAIEFYTLGRQSGVKPIIGCEVYVAPGDRRDKEHRPGQPVHHHLVLLAENNAGYQNLLKIVTDAYFNGFYYKPRTDLNYLAEHHQGLIALSACLHGEVAANLVQDRQDEARAAAGRLADIFGRKSFYIEVQDAGIPEQAAINPQLLKLANDLDLAAVATNDCHYLDREDAEAHDVLLAIQTGKQIDDDKRLRFSSDLLYFRPPEEMVERFRFQPELARNTLAVAERCQVELSLGEHHFPRFPLPQGQTAEEVLREKAMEGLAWRFESLALGAEKQEAYSRRLDQELGVITGMGFASYFLVVADFIQWAKGQAIPVGPGRGSAAGSLVAYALSITDLDPIPYNLLFERFLNSERVSMPDIDIDFCVEKRDQVLAYVTERYDPQNVAQITTFGKMKARAVVRDVGRVLGLAYGEVDMIAKLIPYELGMTLKKAQEQEPRLGELRRRDEAVDRLLSLAERLEGLCRHASTHAAGVVIADKPLVEYLPLYQDKNHKTVTQFAMKYCEKIGLIKFDFLGLRTLTVIDDASRLVRESRDGDFDIRRIPLDDAAAFELLGRGDTTGIFQLESSGMKELLVRFKPESFEDIIALVALYRPGPMDLIPDFVDRKHGRQPVTYPHPDLASILKDTYGIIVYQEQVMAVANLLAGYTLGQADILRRAMGKKEVKVMEHERVRFVAGAAEKGHPKELADQVFDLLAKFAGYGFNKSHAAAYGLIAYQTAFLKAHYPAQFMAAQLSSVSTDSDKVIVQIAACKEMGLEVLPPEINASGRDFGAAGQTIRFGLAAVKNVGAGAVEAIVEARAEDPFEDLFDFCSRVDTRRVNKRVVESLIKCGAFDSTHGHRAQLLAVLDEAVGQGARRQKDQAEGQFSRFDLDSAESRAALPLPGLEEWPEEIRLGYEKEALGFYVSGHPLVPYVAELKRYADSDLTGLHNLPDGSRVRVGGMAASSKEISTKKGERMAFLTLEDLAGRVEVVCMPKIWAESRGLLESEEPLVISGQLKHNERGASLKADEIIPLSQAVEKLTSEVRLRFELGGDADERLRRLKAVLGQYPGPIPLFLHLRSPDQFEVVVAADKRFGLSPGEEIFARIRDILGPDS
ncbi:MAG: DNA polymerase III subunit alpha, partial [Deltaproteobacteria bacterium]|nr:DNA polymerase III subunit alpha [Deltaproteobacteria bacterium]